MATLHLGVIDQPYREWKLNKAGTRRVKGKILPITTFDVAKILEKKYEVMGTYYRVHQKDIADSLAKSVTGAIQALVVGQRIDPFGAATQKMQSGFKDFIASREAERVGIPGTPTMAALLGVNHRLRHPYAAGNPRRPSFLDTGLYMSSFRAWVD
jgi:hypothetical protein